MTDQQHPITPPPEMIDQITLNEAIRLVKFTKNSANRWVVHTVNTNVIGNVHGDIGGDVCGSVGGSVIHNVIGNVHGSIGGDVCGDVNGNLFGTIFAKKLNYHTAKATEWNWQQRDASVADELQKARDEELEACLSWIRERTGPWTTEQLRAARRAARRPKPKSRAEEALALISHDPENQPFLSEKGIAIIRRALERLQELEGQGDD